MTETDRDRQRQTETDRDRQHLAWTALGYLPAVVLLVEVPDYSYHKLHPIPEVHGVERHETSTGPAVTVTCLVCLALLCSAYGAAGGGVCDVSHTVAVVLPQHDFL